jgi:hypothetical protein
MSPLQLYAGAKWGVEWLVELASLWPRRRWRRYRETLYRGSEIFGAGGRLFAFLYDIDLKPPLPRLDVSGTRDVAWTVLPDQ